MGQEFLFSLVHELNVGNTAHAKISTQTWKYRVLGSLRVYDYMQTYQYISLLEKGYLSEYAVQYKSRPPFFHHCLVVVSLGENGR